MASSGESCAARQDTSFMSFQINERNARGDATRLGTLRFNHRTPIETPHYIAITSRGAVPHLSQDTMRESTAIKGVYVALEDCML